MDKLSAKTEKVKVLSLKLNYVTKHLDDLLSKKVVIKTCDFEINQYFHRMLETRDSILTVSVCQHLTEKLKPVFSMLDRACISEGDALPKQGRTC